jgi:hypothetical protein
MINIMEASLNNLAKSSPKVATRQDAIKQEITIS